MKHKHDDDDCVCFSRIEHLKSQNDLLTITLEECKGNAERMSMLVGKYESNATALRLALQYRYTLTHMHKRISIHPYTRTLAHKFTHM